MLNIFELWHREQPLNPPGNRERKTALRGRSPRKFSLFGKPDTSRVLAGSEVGFEIPDLGVFPGRNLTPDKETGLGNWSTPQIVTALQTGMRRTSFVMKIVTSDMHTSMRY